VAVGGSGPGGGFPKEELCGGAQGVKVETVERIQGTVCFT